MPRFRGSDSVLSRSASSWPSFRIPDRRQCWSWRTTSASRQVVQEVEVSALGGASSGAWRRPLRASSNRARSTSNVVAKGFTLWLKARAEAALRCSSASSWAPSAIATRARWMRTLAWMSVSRSPRVSPSPWRRYRRASDNRGPDSGPGPVDKDDGKGRDPGQTPVLGEGQRALQPVPGSRETLRVGSHVPQVAQAGQDQVGPSSRRQSSYAISRNRRASVMFAIRRWTAPMLNSRIPRKGRWRRREGSPVLPRPLSGPRGIDPDPVTERPESPQVEPGLPDPVRRIAGRGLLHRRLAERPGARRVPAAARSGPETRSRLPGTWDRAGRVGVGHPLASQRAKEANSLRARMG